MKLHLTNYQRYKDQTFSLGEKGITLISGKSGAGKSTILDAIYFVLYGIGTKVVTFGKKKMSAKLTTDKYTITRSKGPNRLLLENLKGVIYEDAAAQGIINKEYGSRFDIVSYIRQDTFKSFIYLSPTEKLHFLENLVFRDIDIDSIRRRLKEKLGEYKHQNIALSTKISVLKDKLSDKPMKVSFPIKTDDKSGVSLREGIRLTKARKTLKKLRTKESKVRKKITELTIYNNTIDSIQEQLNDLEKTIDTLPEIMRDEEISERIQDKLRKISSIQRFIKQTNIGWKIAEKLTEKESLEKTLEKQKHDFTVNQKQLTNIPIKLLKKDLLTIQSNKRIQSQLDEIDITDIKSTIEDLNDSIYQAKQNNAVKYKCPGCKLGVCVVDGELVEIETSREMYSLEKLEKSLKRAVGTQRMYTLLEKQLLPIVTDIIAVKKDIEEYYQLESIIASSKRTISELESKISNLTAEINNLTLEMKTLRDAIKGSLSDIEGLQEDVQDLKVRRKTIISENNNRKKALRQIQVLYDKMGLCKEDFNDKYGELCDISQVESDILNTQKNICKHTEKIQKHTTNLEKIKKWESYQTSLKVWKENKVEIADCEKELEIVGHKTSAYTRMREEIAKAESITLINVISAINDYGQKYLDIFFQDDPISIMISPFKVGKKTTKPQLNLEIEYKGISHTLDMLSGGERARIVLAYTLALSEMYHQDLLLLDESISSLDTELSRDIIYGIKRVCKNMLILLIAHQVSSEADFDKIIVVEK